MTTPSYTVEPLFSEAEIASRLSALAQDINQHYAESRGLVAVGLLRGSFVFLADLVRELTLPIEVDFMAVSSYADATTSSGEVRVMKDLDGDIAGLDVLVVEDIVDTGLTLRRVLDLPATRGPRSLEVCTLLDKPSRRQVAVPVRWTGFEIPDEFVVGYGIDYAQRNRGLPYVGTIRMADSSSR